MMFRRLAWQPVEHTCGHFEARLMAVTTNNHATSPCSECAPQGRPVQAHYQTWDACRDVCRSHNDRDNR